MTDPERGGIDPPPPPPPPIVAGQDPFSARIADEGERANLALYEAMKTHHAELTSFVQQVEQEKQQRG